MADGVAITAGSGTTVATEDEAGVHYQKIKLTASGTGTTEDLSKAEDAAHSSGHHGIMSLGVRQDTPANLSGTDGDYEPFQVSAGRVWTSAKLDTAIPAGTNNIGDVDVLTLPDNATVNVTQMNSVAVSMGNGASGTGVQRVTLANDSTGIVALTTSTASIGKLASNTGVDIGDVDVTSIIPGTGATNLGKADDAGRTAGDTGVPALAVRRDADTSLVSATNDYSPLLLDASGYLKVNVKAGSASSTQYATNVAYADGNTGTMALAVRDDALTTLTEADGDFSALRVDSTGSHWVTLSNAAEVIGTTAHDTADANAPVKVGAKASTSLSGLTLVADADRTNLFSGIDGVQIVRNHCNLEDIVTGNASNTDGTSTACITAQAAGIKTYLTRVTLTNTSATFVAVEIKDGTTAKHTVPVPPTSGATIGFDPPIPGTAATAWNFDSSAAATTLYCSMVGFKSKV